MAPALHLDMLSLKQLRYTFYLLFCHHFLQLLSMCSWLLRYTRFTSKLKRRPDYQELTTEIKTDNSNQKQANKIHFKPIITILVVVLGSAFINLFFPLMYLLGRYLIEAKAYKEFMEFIIVPNIIFVVLLLHPLVYGVYFKQVCELMMRCFRGLICLQPVNTATVASQPPRIALM